MAGRVMNKFRIPALKEITAKEFKSGLREHTKDDKVPRDKQFGDTGT